MDGRIARGWHLKGYLIGAYVFLCPFESALNQLLPGSFRVLGICIAAVVLVEYALRRTLLRWTSFHSLLILFAALEGLSLLWTTSRVYSGLYLSSHISMTLFLIALSLSTGDRDDSILLKKATVLGAATSATIMILSASLYHDIGFRYTLVIFGAELDPNNFAAFLLMGVGMALSMWVERTPHRIWYAVITIPAFIGLLMTGSRGSLLGMGGVLLFYFFRFLSGRRIFLSGRRHRFSGLGVAAIGIVSVLLVLAVGSVFLSDDLKERLFDLGSYTMNNERIAIWRYALAQIGNRFWFGYGIGSFPESSAAYFGKMVGMHNTYLTFLYETGIFGLLASVGVLVLLLRNAVKARCDAAIVVLLAGVVPSFFLDAFVQRYYWNALLLAYLFLQAAPRPDAMLQPAKRETP